MGRRGYVQEAEVISSQMQIAHTGRAHGYVDVRLLPDGHEQDSASWPDQSITERLHVGTDGDRAIFRAVPSQHPVPVWEWSEADQEHVLAQRFQPADLYLNSQWLGQHLLPAGLRLGDAGTLSYMLMLRNPIDRVLARILSHHTHHTRRALECSDSNFYVQALGGYGPCRCRQYPTHFDLFHYPSSHSAEATRLCNEQGGEAALEFQVK